MNNPNFIKYIKEQYPPGARIRLGAMQDPYSPVPPGTMGSVTLVDDAGTIHMKWDNGRSLGLIPGEDSFSVAPQALTSMKLYIPLNCELYQRDDYGNLEEYPCEINGKGALEYEDKIFVALEKYRHPEEAQRGLMHWYGKSDSVNDKVHSAVFSVEQREGSLWGIVKAELKGELNCSELTTLKDYITGQAADGWAEGFEQQEVKTDDGSLYVHLWSSDEDWQVMTEAEFVQQYEQTQAQEPQLGDMSY